MTKKRKCATALLATTLLSYGFTLNNKEENVQPLTTELVATTDSEPQDLVSQTKSNTHRKTGQPPTLAAPEQGKDEHLEDVTKQTEPHSTEQTSTQLIEQVASQPTEQTSTQPTVQAPSESTEQAQPTTSPPEELMNIPEPDSMNSIDYGRSQTIQPDPDPKPTYTQAQLTDPTQTPDGTPVETSPQNLIIPEGATVIYHYPTEKELQPVYVPGFGWVEHSGEPTIQIIADDMYESGNKVGTMGGD